MSAKKPNQKIDDEVIDSPTAWFAALDRARLTDDYELAARAKRELERLGVRVRFTVRGKVVRDAI
jgi:hypothetical protein